MKFHVVVLVSLLVLRCEARNIPNFGNVDEDPGVTRFREYLRIRTDHPNPDYESAIVWLQQQSVELGLEFHRLDFEAPAEFAIWMTWTGSNPTLKSVLINSHMDVVAVDESKWEFGPFDAHKDDAGNIYGRGASDMKSSTIATLEAIRRLKSTGFVPLRTIHISVLPDEENGGYKGMKPIVESAEFQALNVGFDMDETSVNGGAEVLFEYGQKSVWQFNYTALGTAEHGSNMPEETAAHRIELVIQRLMEYRATQYDLMTQPGNTIANCTSVNLARMGGGIGDNTIAGELWASFDMRIRVTPEWTFSNVEAMLDAIAEEAGPEVSYVFLSKNMETGETTPDDSNPWWRALQDGCAELSVTCEPNFLKGATDGKFVRALGIPVFGVNAFINSPVMAHMDNEHINEQQFLAGIDRYVTWIQKVTAVSETENP